MADKLPANNANKLKINYAIVIDSLRNLLNSSISRNLQGKKKFMIKRTFGA
jgi:hypothetical protein